MYLHSAYVSILAAAIAALCFAVALAVPPAFVGPKPDASPDPAISDTVNRASKGDRLRVIVRPPDAAPFEVQAPAGSTPKALDGCESAFGHMDHSPAARFAQNCVT
jgi:ABC-type amino acid transport substrate-binding protein